MDFLGKKALLGLFLAFLGIFISPPFLHAQAPASPPWRQVKVGFAPYLVFCHPALIRAEGWDKELGLEFVLERFPAPPAMTQAFASGQLDVIWNNAATPLLLANRGIASRVIASSMKDDVFLLGRPALVSLRKNRNAAQAIEAFKTSNGRPVKIITNPRGTMSDLIVQDWLERSFSKPEDWVEIIHATNPEQMQQALLSGAADAASMFEPAATMAHLRDSSLEIFAKPGELMEDQPGGVVILRTALLEKEPELARKIAKLQIRATNLLRDNPSRAASLLSRTLWEGLIPPEALLAAIRSKRDCFIADPSAMLNSTRKLQEWMFKASLLSRKIETDELFEKKVFEQAKF